MRSPGTPIGQESPIDRSRERHTGSRHNRSPRRRAPASLIHVTPPVLLEPGGLWWLTPCEPDGTLPLTLCPPSLRQSRGYLYWAAKRSRSNQPPRLSLGLYLRDVGRGGVGFTVPPEKAGTCLPNPPRLRLEAPVAPPKPARQQKANGSPPRTVGSRPNSNGSTQKTGAYGLPSISTRLMRSARSPKERG